MMSFKEWWKRKLGEQVIWICCYDSNYFRINLVFRPLPAEIILLSVHIFLRRLCAAVVFRPVNFSASERFIDPLFLM